MKRVRKPTYDIQYIGYMYVYHIHSILYLITPPPTCNSQGISREIVNVRIWDWYLRMSNIITKLLQLLRGRKSNLLPSIYEYYLYHHWLKKYHVWFWIVLKQGFKWKSCLGYPKHAILYCASYWTWITPLLSLLLLSQNRFQSHFNTK
mgnify:CR=1 FL=1